MQCVWEIVGCVAEPLKVVVKEHLGCLISSTEYVRNMNNIMRQLDDKRVVFEKKMRYIDRNDLEIPPGVLVWLEEVKKIKLDVGRISSNGNGDFNMVRRYRVGREALEITQKIEDLKKEALDIDWTDIGIPLGEVNSGGASTSATINGGTEFIFESRDLVFKNALKSLQPDNQTQMIALCGMGGVGKTTMMEQLKKAVEDRKMFDSVVKAVIGEKTDPISFQQAIIDYMGLTINERTKAARAERLHKIFEGKLQDGKNKILIILDDVWEMVDLKDIGLSPLPNGFKLLLTSRFEYVCTQMGVETNSIFRVVFLTDLEAKNFFCRIAGLSDGADPELHEIGKAIVNRCHGLPIALKTIASALRDNKKDAWKVALSSLEHNDLQDVDDKLQKVFEMSYNNLKKDVEKAIFLLSGLFPDDFDIPMEDLMRYGWGLKLFNKAYTLAEARQQTNTCVDKLIRANLLIESDHVGCIKMHDLLRAFVLSNFSKVKQASIVNHDGNMSRWSAKDSERILLECTGLHEFPVDFKYPNLTLLKLMNGDKLLKFPKDFYGRMEKLEVVAYESMHTPLLPVSPQYSTELRTLCLRSCSLMDDLSLLGNLINLEILSFAHCSIRKLPSTIGKLTKLKLLDLTGCVDLRIDDDVFRNLHHLEELYMRIDKQAIRFTDSNCNELAERSKNLSALEIEFFKNNAQPKNMSFKKLERFKISMGCYLIGNMDKDMHPFENTLMLVTNKDELLESRMNLLFEKTEVLQLEVVGVNDLKDVLVESLHPEHSFYNLRVLDVFKCADLRCLFTVPMASGLAKLERLKISSCPVLEVLVHGENSGAGVIKFKELKFMSLNELPKLVSLCNIDNVVELPQLVELRLDGLPNFNSIYPENKSTRSSRSSNISAMQPFLNKEVVIPKLEKLEISSMENLKQIWPCQITASEEVNISMLRKIGVKQCDSLVNLFPSNPLPLLENLEELEVENCGSIEVLFNIDMGCVPEIEEHSCRLRYITVKELGKLRELWRMKGVNNSDILIRSFKAVESITIKSCKRFGNVFSPTTTNFDLGTLAYIEINGVEEWGRVDELVESSSQEINVISMEQTSVVDDIAFPSYHLRTFHHLQTLGMRRDNRVEVVFKMESASSREFPTTRNNQPPLLLPYLKNLELQDMKRMTHVWKCNWNKFLIPQQQQLESAFHNLTNIQLWASHNIKYLFSPLMAKLLSNLENVKILFCNSMEEVVSNRDDENEENATSTSSHKNTTFFPHLEILELYSLGRLKCIGGGGARHGNNKITSNITTTITSIHEQFQCAQVTGASWSLCQYPREISISSCDALSSVIPSFAIGQMQKLEVLKICYCKSMMEVFETQGIYNSGGGGSSNNVGEGSGGTGTTLTIPRLKNITVLKLPNLKILHISGCDRLEHIFMFSTLESLKQLKELKVEKCEAMQVIVKEENNREHTTTSKSVDFPRLESLELVNLPNLKGFFLGMNDFQWELLDKVKIFDCPQMMVFTSGQSTARKLNWIHTSLGKHSLECGLNFHGTTNLHQTAIPSLDGTSSYPATEEIPWSFPNLIEIDVVWDYNIKKIIPSNELLQLQKLEKIHVKHCHRLKKVFKVKGTHSGFNESEYVVKFPKLIEVELCQLDNLKYIWKSNQWTVLEFPNLTRVSIQECDSLKRAFTCSMVGSPLHLQELHIRNCRKMKVIVEEVDLQWLHHLKHIWNRKMKVIKEVDLQWLHHLKHIWKTNQWTVLEFPNLTRVSIVDCERLEHVFTCSMVGSLLQLQELHISDCTKLEVIVKEANVVVEDEEEESDAKVNEIMLSHLKSLKLKKLKSLKGFCLGKEAFSWPLLDTLKIKECPAITVFTEGRSATPELKVIKTSFGICYVREDLNSFIKTKQQEGFEF